MQDVDALRLADRALATQRRIAIVPDDPRTPIGPLIAATAHVHALIDENNAGRTPRSPLRVAVVTRDLRSRSFYRSLTVSSRPGRRGELLRAAVPAATVGTDGSPVPGDGWSTVFAEDSREVSAFPLDLAIVETPIGDIRSLDRLRCPVIVVARDPADASAAALLSSWPAFAYVTDQTAADVVTVPNQGVCQEAALFWQDAAGVLRAAAGTGLGPRLLRESFSLFYDLTGLAVPIQVFEKTAGSTFAERASALGRIARVLHGELRDLWLPMVEVELEALTNAVRAASPDKSTALAYTLDDAIAQRQTVLVVARTAAHAVALEGHLPPSLPGVRIGTLAALDDEDHVDLMIIPGALPSWARWVYRTRNADRIRVLTWTGDSKWDEAERVSGAVTRQRALVTAIAEPSRRGQAWTGITASAPSPLPPLKVTLNGHRLDVRDLPPPPEAPPGLFADANWTAAVEPPPGEQQTRFETAALVDAVHVGFDDGTSTWLAASGIAHRWSEVAGEVRPCPVSVVHIGDTLILLDDDAHKGLVEKVLEAADRVPELAVAAAWHVHWRQALTGAYAKAGGSYASLGSELRRLGCGVQDQTIRLWCIGAVVGPQDPDDVQRVGTYLSDAALTTANQHVHSAIRTLRNAHVRLGMRVARLARTAGPRAQTSASLEDVLDDGTGLTASDLERSVSLRRVASLQAHSAVPRLLLGVLTAPGDKPSIHLTDTIVEGK